MADEKSVLTILCDIINICCTENVLKTEYFFINDSNFTEGINSLTRVIEDLAQTVVVEKLGKQMSIQHISDRLLRVKLLMSYLEYPLPDFFIILSTKYKESLNSLNLALGWLIIEQNALEYFICQKLSHCELYSKKIMQEITKNIDKNTPVQNYIDSLLKDCGKLNYNLKEISELLKTKGKVTSKVHSASHRVLGIRHLSAEELALIKRITENKKGETEPSKEYLKELHRQAVIVDNFIKFKKNINHFIKWMICSQNAQNHESSQMDIGKEVFEFLNLMRKMIKTNLQSEKDNCKNFKDGCMQLVKVNSDFDDTSVWLSKLTSLINQSNDHLKSELDFLTDEFNQLFQNE